MKTQERDYYKGLKSGFKANHSSEPDQNMSLYYKMGYDAGKRAHIEYLSTETILNQFQDKK